MSAAMMNSVDQCIGTPPRSDSTSHFNNLYQVSSISAWQQDEGAIRMPDMESENTSFKSHPLTGPVTLSVIQSFA